MLMYGLSVLALALGAAGIAALHQFVVKRFGKTIETIEKTPLTAVGQLAPGLRKAIGKTVALEKPVISPMTKTECVFYHFKVEELVTSQQGSYKTRSGSTKSTTSSSSWVTVVNDRQAVPCGLQDDTGMAQVELLGAEMQLTTGKPQQSSMFKGCPPELEKTLKERYEFNTKGMMLAKSLRYTEMIIRPGDKLLVVGDVESKGGKPPTFVKRDHTFLVSDKEESEVLKHFRRSTIGAYFVMGMVAVITLAVAAAPIYIHTQMSNLGKPPAPADKPIAAPEKKDAGQQVAKRPNENKKDQEKPVSPPPQPKDPAPQERPAPKEKPAPAVKADVPPPAEPNATPLLDTKVAIVSVASGRAIETDKEKKITDRTVIVLRTKDGLEAPHRQWMIKRDPGTEYFTIVNVASNRLLDAERFSSNRDGTKVHLFGTETQGNKERLWQFREAGPDTVYIVNVANGRYLEADPNSLEKKNTPIRLWGQAGEDKPARKWSVIRTP
jgi:hypothetical protein